MSILATVGALILMLVILQNAFETIILPRRIARQLRLARLVFRFCWKFWSAAGRRMPTGSRREAFLRYFGPLSIIILLAALTTILDACALGIASVEGFPVRPAFLTFAMSRHIVVDLSLILDTPPRAPDSDTLTYAV